MTKKLYYELPYVKEFEGEVISCEPIEGGFEIVLNQTGFYPEGGGQPSDTGLLGDSNVLHVREKGGVIYHKADRPVEAGSIVSGRLDWDKRYSNMQNHTGEHVVSGLIHKKFGYDNVGFHMGQEAITLDMNGILTEEDLLEIEDLANEKIYANLPVLICHPDGDSLKSMEYRSKKELTGDVRIVKIPDADNCACCGTHVENLGEVGIIKLIGAIKYKGGTRVSMLCGKRALKDYQEKQKNVAGISALLSSKPSEVQKAALKLKQECTDKEFLIGSLYRQIFELRAEAYPKGSSPVVILENNLEPSLLRHFAAALAKRTQLALVAAGTEKDGYRYAAAGSMDMKEIGREINSSLNGKGGGNKEMIQGTLFSPWESVLDYFNKIEMENQIEKL